MRQKQFHRIALVRREDKPIDAWKELLEKHGFQHDQKRPDLVFSIGGDGTFLIAERHYPGIPKVLIRDSKICNKCYDGTPEELLQNLKEQKFHLQELPKLAATLGKRALYAVNEITLRNRYPTGALRFQLHGPTLPSTIQQELIGDGIVIATTFGAMGYFYSITKKTFSSGFGIAWNNLRTIHDPLFLPAIKLHFTLHRGDAVVTTDNNPNIISLKDGDSIHLTVSDAKTYLVQIT